MKAVSALLLVLPCGALGYAPALARGVVSNHARASTPVLVQQDSADFSRRAALVGGVASLVGLAMPVNAAVAPTTAATSKKTKAQAMAAGQKKRSAAATSQKRARDTAAKQTAAKKAAAGKAKAMKQQKQAAVEKQKRAAVAKAKASRAQAAAPRRRKRGGGLFSLSNIALLGAAGVGYLALADDETASA